MWSNIQPSCVKKSVNKSNIRIIFQLLESRQSWWRWAHSLLSGIHIIFIPNLHSTKFHITKLNFINFCLIKLFFFYYSLPPRTVIFLTIRFLIIFETRIQYRVGVCYFRLFSEGSPFPLTVDLNENVSLLDLTAVLRICMDSQWFCSPWSRSKNVFCTLSTKNIQL
jgi:hypothetical protein